jgi:hypothetical protein
MLNKLLFIRDQNNDLLIENRNIFLSILLISLIYIYMDSCSEVIVVSSNNISMYNKIEVYFFYGFLNYY